MGGDSSSLEFEFERGIFSSWFRVSDLFPTISWSRHRRTQDEEVRETKKPTYGELLMFRLLVSRSATSLHLHTEEE